MPSTASGASATGWEPAVVLSRDGHSVGEVQAALDGAGNAYAVWGSPTAVSLPGDLIIPAPVVSHPGGTVSVAWKRLDGGRERVEANIRDTDGTWTGPVALSAPASSLGGAHVAVGPGGDAVVVWVSRDGDGYVVHSSARRSGDRAWGAPDAVSPSARTALQPAVAVDVTGNAVAVRVADDAVQTSRRPAASGRWSAPTSLGPGLAPVVAIDPNGDALAVWTSGAVHAARLDGPPTVAIAAPRRATTGRRVALTARTVPWAPPADIPRRRFGDGGTARGQAVTHTYRRPGAYRVTVTQADAVGKTGSATARIVVVRGKNVTGSSVM